MNQRGGFHGLFRRLGRLIQTIPSTISGLSEHVIETIRIARRDYLNDRQITPLLEISAAQNIFYFLFIIFYLNIHESEVY